MGKGSRNRQVRVDDMSVNPQKYVQKKKAPKYLSTVIMVALIVVIVAALVFSGITNGGMLLRAGDAVESENFTIDGTMMSYFVHNYYQSYVSSFQSTYSSLLSSGSYTVYDLIGIDPDVSLKDQVKNKETGETWFDYFLTQARAEAEEILVYCEGARAAGVELEENDYASIDSSVQMVKIYAQLYGYSTSSYFANMYGTGVREKDVRRAMELSTLANKYAQKLSDDGYAAATDEKVNAFFADHTTDYLSTDYLMFKMDASKAKLATDATEEQKTEADTSYAAAKAKIDEFAETLKAVKSADEFRETVRAYLDTAEALETYMDEYYEDYLEDAEGDTDEAKAAAAEAKVKETMKEEIDAQVEALLYEKVAYSNATDANKWMYGEEGKNPAAVGATYVEVDDSKDAEGTYTVNVYFITRASSRDEAATYDVAYLALASTSYKQEDADAALKAFEEAGADKDALLALATKYPSHNGCTDIENMREGYFGMADVDDWTFNAERKAGDYKLITHEYGTGTSATTYYMLVYIIGEGDAAWYADTLDDMVAAECEQWIEDAAKTYPVYVSEKVLAKIGM